MLAHKVLLINIRRWQGRRAKGQCRCVSGEQQCRHAGEGCFVSIHLPAFVWCLPALVCLPWHPSLSFVCSQPDISACTHARTHTHVQAVFASTRGLLFVLQPREIQALDLELGVPAGRGFQICSELTIKMEGWCSKISA